MIRKYNLQRFGPAYGLLMFTVLVQQELLLF